MSIKIVLLVAMLLLANLAGAQLINNGSFESGLSGWSSSLTSGGVATFTNSTIHRKGTNALLVTVSNPGTASNSVQLVSSSFTASNSDTYVLRFWMNTTVLRAHMGINILGATPVYPQIPFQISTNPVVPIDYQEYIYPFKASGTVSIAFNFQMAANYYLDDVEVLKAINPDDTNNWDIPMTYLWRWGQWNYSQTNQWGWSGGDNQKSVLLPDGSVAWICNDSFGSIITNYYTNLRNSTALPRNSLVHQVGTNLYWMNNGTATYFVPTNASDFYWIGGAVVEDTNLMVLLQEYNTSSGARVAQGVATVSLPDLTLQSIVTITAAGNTGFGDLMTGDDGYYYVYGGYGTGKFARVPIGGLTNNSAWTFWNGSSWVSDYTQIVAITNFYGWSNVRLGPSNYAVVNIPNGSYDIQAQFATSPMGPWTSLTTVYPTKFEWGEYNYMPNICAGTGSNGVYTIDFSDNGTPEGLSKWTSDRSFYAPHYVKVDLLDASPYTWTNGANLAAGQTVAVSSTSGGAAANAVDNDPSTYWSSGFSDSEWIRIDLGTSNNINQVRLNWGLAYGQSYQIQTSNDKTNWTTVYSTTNGAGGIETIGFPSTQARYVRMNGTKRGTSWGYTIREFQVFAPVDLALNRTVAVTSTSGGAAPNAVDGDTSTYWSSGFSDAQWIRVDMGMPYNISQVQLNWGLAYGQSYQIQTSNDKTNWTDVYSTTNGLGGIENISFSPTTARYVRMNGTKRGTSWGYTLYEFQIFGDGAGSPANVTAAPPTLLYTYQGAGVLQFNWIGAFKLQFQTNTLTVGLSTNWVDYPGGSTSPVLVTNNLNVPSAFFRLSQ